MMPNFLQICAWPPILDLDVLESKRTLGFFFQTIIALYNDFFPVVQFIFLLYLFFFTYLIELFCINKRPHIVFGVCV